MTSEPEGMQRDHAKQPLTSGNDNKKIRIRAIRFLFALPGAWLAFKAIETGLLRSREPEWLGSYSTKKLLFLIAAFTASAMWIKIVIHLKIPDRAVALWTKVEKGPKRLFLCVSTLSAIAYSGQGVGVGEDIAGQVKSSLQWHRGETSFPNVITSPDWSNLAKEKPQWSLRPPGASWLAMPGLWTGFPLGTSIRLGLLILTFSAGLGWLTVAKRVGIPPAGLSLLALCLALSAGSDTYFFSTANIILAGLFPWLVVWVLRLAKAMTDNQAKNFCLWILLEFSALYLVLGSLAWIKLSGMIAAITLAVYSPLLLLYMHSQKKRWKHFIYLLVPVVLFLLPYLALEKANREWSGSSADNMYRKIDYNKQSLLWGKHFTESTKGGFLAWSLLGGPGYALPAKGIVHGFRDFLSQFKGIWNWCEQHGVNRHAFFSGAIGIALTTLLFLTYVRLQKTTSIEIQLLFGCFLTLPFAGLSILSNLHGFNHVLYHAHTSEFAFILTLLAALAFFQLKTSFKLSTHALTAVCLALPMVTQAERLFRLPFSSQNILPSPTESGRNLGSCEFSEAIRLIEEDSQNDNDILLFLPQGNMSDLIIRTRLRSLAIHFAGDNLANRVPLSTSSTLRVYCAYSASLKNDNFLQTLRSAFPTASEHKEITPHGTPGPSVFRFTVKPSSKSTKKINHF